MVQIETTNVLIDGHYLSLISKHFGEGVPIKFSINNLAILISKNENLWCQKIYYYTAPPYQNSVPTSEENIRRANYDKFISTLKKNPHFIIREGRCQKIDGVFKQKGVDTHVIIDLKDIAADVKQIILIACDTDFVPIIENIKKKHNVKIILYYYSDFKRNSHFSMSNHLIKVCDKCVLLKKAHLDRCLIIDKNID